MNLKERNKGEILIVSSNGGWGSHLSAQADDCGYFAYHCEDPEEARVYMEYVYTLDRYNPPRLILAEVDGKAVTGAQRDFLVFLVEKARMSHTPVLVWDSSDSRPEALYEIGVNAVLSPVPEAQAAESARSLFYFWLEISVHRVPRIVRSLPTQNVESGSMLH